MNILKSILICLPLVLFKNDSAKDYYFQLPDLTNSIVFKYECKEDASKIEYWKLTSNTLKKTLITEAYTSDFNKYEFFVEEFTDSGSKVTNFTSYYKNKSGEVEVIKRRLKDTDVFMWTTDVDCHYSAEFVDKTYGQVSFSMYRTYEKEAVISVLGTAHPVLKYKCMYRTKIPETNYDYEYTQYMYYAKGLGLVKMEKTYPDGKTVVLELSEIISKADWDKMQ